MGFTTTQARKELERINKKLKGYDALLTRKRQLESFLTLADQLTKKSKSKRHETQSSELLKLPIGRTSDVAARVLQQKGQLHLKELHRLMRASGWSGSGNDLNEQKAIYVGMLRDNRFVRAGRNIWALRESQTKAAS